MAEKEIKKEYKWNLRDIYKSYKEWEKDFGKVQKLKDELLMYKGKFSDEKKLSEFLKKQEELDKIAYKLYAYPQLARDLNSSDKEATENLQKIQFLFSEITTELSWVNPELIENRKKIEKYIKKEEFSDYKFGLENLFRLQKHVLNERESKLLSYFGSFFSTPRTVYTEVTVTDVEWPVVKLSTGEKAEATPANYTKVLTKNRNQKDRKLIFDSYYGVYKRKENTIAAIYNSILQKDIAKMKAYEYDSFLLSFLEGNNIPEEVYMNLINTAKENTKPLKRYLKLRKKILGLKKYHNYDGSVNLIEFNKEYEQLKFFESVNQLEIFDKRISRIPLNQIIIKQEIMNLEKEVKNIREEISKITKNNNTIGSHIFEVIIKYATELEIGDKDSISPTYLFTSNLKELSGAILHKTVFAFKLGYISAIKKKLNIKLPILLDSPTGKEVDQENIKLMMNILKSMVLQEEV